jgi:hypothetical protein
MMKFKGLVVPLICMVLAAVGCNVFLPSQFQSNRPNEPAQVSATDRVTFQNAWIGKSMSDVQAKFGPPTQMETLEDTGGKRSYYRESGQPHYVFEYNPMGKVISADMID